MTLPSAAELEHRAAGLLAQWRVHETAVRVQWNPRLSTTAGRAFLRGARIELNPTLLGRAPDQLPMVLAHEAAHIAAFRLFGPNIPAHGRHWRSLMRLAGHAPEVTHRIPVDGGPRRRGRRAFLYLRVCEACGDRRILAAVRYGRCHGCEARDSYLVVKSPATAAGRAQLERTTLTTIQSLHRN
ncbi:MAG: SprT-like domain-containing protein [Planctomycetes bacterium]|nr:SprT-like domain-containing protein [Planctomycetota bacterium]